MMMKPMAALGATLFLGALLAGCTAADNEELVATLHASYKDQPFKGGQETPDHEWSFIDSSREHIAFLHWMPETRDGQSTDGDAEQADHLFATGEGFKARWCKGTGGVSQAQIDAGFVHFHKETSANWDAGHGGDSATQVGFWLRHIAAESGIEMMPGVVSQAGKVYPLMPTTSGLPDCEA